MDSKAKDNTPEIKLKDNGYYGATISSSLSYTGKKIQIQRKSQEDAQKDLDFHLGRIKNYGKSAKKLTPELESAVITGLNTLTYEPTPTDVIKIFSDHELRRNKDISTLTFTECWEKVMKEINSNFSISEIGKSDRGDNFSKHYSSMRHIGRRFNEKHGDRLLVDITKKDIMRFIDGTGVSKVSKTSYRQALGAIFSYAVEQAEIDENPCWSNTKRRNKSDGETKPNKSLPLDKIILILKTMPHELIPYYTICLFAGLRQSEIFRLVWDDVNFEENVIIVRNPKGSTDKDTPNRIAQIIEPLIEWLKPFKEKTGQVCPKNWKPNKVYPHRKSIGLMVEGLGKKENYKLYPSNCLRHTGCTAWSGKFTRGVAAKQVGNSEKRQASNYDHVWTSKQAEEFFRLTPQYISFIKDVELIG